jgi:hypothetical protein
MRTTPLTGRIERRLADVGIYLAVEDDDGGLVLSGMVTTESERRTALDIATSIAGAATVDDNIEVGGAMPGRLGTLQLATEDAGSFVGASLGLEESAGLEPGTLLAARWRPIPSPPPAPDRAARTSMPLLRVTLPTFPRSTRSAPPGS